MYWRRWKRNTGPGRPIIFLSLGSIFVFLFLSSFPTWNQEAVQKYEEAKLIIYIFLLPQRVLIPDGTFKIRVKAWKKNCSIFILLISAAKCYSWHKLEIITEWCGVKRACLIVKRYFFSFNKLHTTWSQGIISGIKVKMFFLCRNCIYRFILSVLNVHAIHVRGNKTPEQSASNHRVFIILFLRQTSQLLRTQSQIWFMWLISRHKAKCRC